MTNPLLHNYHDARRREDEWRVPQTLLALVTPLIALMAMFFAASAETGYASITAALAVITGTAAALLTGEVWRLHRMAIGIGKSVRTHYPDEAALFLKDLL